MLEVISEKSKDLAEYIVCKTPTSTKIKATYKHLNAQDDETALEKCKLRELRRQVSK